jgi:hypothetical protein
VIAMTDDAEELGPIDFLVIEFPEDRLTGEGLPILLDLVDRGIIRILDFLFVRKDADGVVTAVAATDLPAGSADLALFDDARSGLLDAEDVLHAGSVLEPGSAAGVLLYENRWAAPFAAAMRRGGGQLVASGRIPVQGILAALDAAEAADSADPTASVAPGS